MEAKKLNEHIEKNKLYDLLVLNKLTESEIEQILKRDNSELVWSWISQYQKLSEVFIEKHILTLNLTWILKYQQLSESFIEKHTDMLNSVYWGIISQYQPLSEGFIEKHTDKINWDNISQYQSISEAFAEKHNISINKDNLWQYQPEEFKKEKLIETDKYECHKNYFIGYIAAREDRYGLGFLYQYLPNKIHENIFGLNVGTYDSAKRELEQTLSGTILKCKICYNDIIKINYLTDSVRCTKIKVLE